MVYLLVVIFILSLASALGASVWFTRRLEVLSDYFHFSAGLLSLLGALGANIPNYVASLTAAISGQVGVGMGIIIGSNIYNIAIVLGISTFAVPARHGIALTRREARDASLVGMLALAMMLTTALAAGTLAWQDTLPASVLARPALLVCNLLTLGLFGVLAFHALRREPEPSVPVEREAASPGTGKRTATRHMYALGEAIVALGLALGAVVVMVQTAQTIALDIHLPATILSLVILAIATSLPNTVVAFTLARTGRASASVEEVFSSNSVNVALGVALPLLFWSSVPGAPSLRLLDAPLMVALTLVALLRVRRQRLDHPTGWLLVLVYVIWVALHLFLSL
jgi:cation:H+ antiporter